MLYNQAYANLRHAMQVLKGTTKKSFQHAKYKKNYI